jgi:hypothetical protein
MPYRCASCLRDEARPEVNRRSLTHYGPNAFVQRRETSVRSSLREGSFRRPLGARKSQTVHPSALSSSRPSARLSLSLSLVEEAAMDRLELETTYLRALEAVMSAVDEHQLQAAIFRLCRAQARLHGWRMPGSHDPERRGLGRGYLVARAGRPSRALRHAAQARGLQGQ